MNSSLKKKEKREDKRNNTIYIYIKTLTCTNSIRIPTRIKVPTSIRTTIFKPTIYIYIKTLTCTSRIRIPTSIRTTI